MQPTRVAYLIYSVGLGGGELLLVNHLTHADRTAFDPLVVCSEEGPLPSALRSVGISVFTLPIHEQASLLGRMNIPKLSTAWRLATLLTREGVGLIHSYTLETRNYAHAAALLTRCPLIHTSQDFWFGDMFRSVQWRAM
ncbi:MAG TPA: glycosyltransferase, partial [Candidatus Acidoferrum sp.]|nr:glycosyltransferase [Candidatus Acidoferrum sp.]